MQETPPRVGEYRTVVVDPPWAYGSAKSGGKPGSAEGQYRTIGNQGREINRRTGAGIENLIGVTPIGEWTATDAHLYLWVTNPKLPFAFQLIDAWGFVYKTTLTWVKTTKTGVPIKNGMGWFFRGCTEHVLFAVKGRLPIDTAKREKNVIHARREGHSVKPQSFAQMVERVSPGPYLDVYARRQRMGWDAWGDEVEDDAPLFSAGCRKDPIGTPD